MRRAGKTLHGAFFHLETPGYNSPRMDKRSFFIAAGEAPEALLGFSYRILTKPCRCLLQKIASVIPSPSGGAAKSPCCAGKRPWRVRPNYISGSMPSTG